MNVDVLRGAQVMVVDDLPANLRVVVAGLREHGVRPLVFTDPARALAAATAAPPDAFVLDIHMPGTDGIELAGQLRDVEALRDVPILFLTASGDAHDVDRAFATGGDDYVTKPVRLGELVARLSAHLERARQRVELAAKNQLLEDGAVFREKVEAMSRHDLKAPLTTVLGFSGLLLERYDLDPDVRELVTRTNRAGQRMLDLINRSLDLFRIEQGLYDEEPEPVGLPALLEEVVRGIDLTTHVTTSPAHDEDETSLVALADPDLLYSAVGNLLRNAAAAAREVGGQVTARVHRDGDEVVLTCSNDGAVPESIRDEFLDLGVTAGKPTGHGLGTYSARRVIEAMGGRLTADTSVPDRTTVQIVLPAADRPASGSDSIDETTS